MHGNHGKKILPDRSLLQFLQIGLRLFDLENLPESSVSSSLTSKIRAGQCAGAICDGGRAGGGRHLFDLVFGSCYWPAYTLLLIKKEPCGELVDLRIECSEGGTFQQGRLSTRPFRM